MAGGGTNDHTNLNSDNQYLAVGEAPGSVGYNNNSSSSSAGGVMNPLHHSSTAAAEPRNNNDEIQSAYLRSLDESGRMSGSQLPRPSGSSGSTSAHRQQMQQQPVTHYTGDDDFDDMDLSDSIGRY